MSNHAFELSVDGQGLYDITAQVSSAVASSGVQDGLVTVFIQHTSASLLIQENAVFLDRLIFDLLQFFLR